MPDSPTDGDRSVTDRRGAPTGTWVPVRLARHWVAAPRPQASVGGVRRPRHLGPFGNAGTMAWDDFVALGVSGASDL